jgi:hypothetical protein
MTIMSMARTGVKTLLLAATILPSAAMAQAGPVSAGPVGAVTSGRGNGVEICCPPIAKQDFAKYFTHHQLPGKNITDTYGLAFGTNPALLAALDTQMKAYAPFAALFAPFGWTGHSVLLDTEMKELSLPNSATPTAADFAAGGNIPVFHNKIRGWYANGTSIWDGPHAGHPWKEHFNDGKDVSPNFMKPNKWYMIKLSLNLASNKPNVPGSWNEDKISCMTKYVVYMVRSASLRTTSGASTANIEAFEVK